MWELILPQLKITNFSSDPNKIPSCIRPGFDDTLSLAPPTKAAPRPAAVSRHFPRIPVRAPGRSHGTPGSVKHRLPTGGHSRRCHRNGLANGTFHSLMGPGATAAPAHGSGGFGHCPEPNLGCPAASAWSHTYPTGAANPVLSHPASARFTIEEPT